jgi:ketosteroid isomerase-like protein
VDRDGVMRWVAEYERAWRTGDLDGVPRLFTDDARYRTSPYAEPKVGHAEIQAFWLDDEGRTGTMASTTKLELKACRPYPSGIVLLNYRIVRSSALARRRAVTSPGWSSARSPAGSRR